MQPFLMHPILRLIRLDKPVGVLLLAFPCLWGVALARPDFALGVKWSLLFMLGAFLLRSAGCVINDLFDQKIDAKVERTQNRPLVTGELTRLQALCVLAMLLFCGGGVFLQLGTQAQILSLGALGISVIYPLAKRFFVLPQLVLGLAFNSGILIAVAHINASLLYTPGPWIFYLGGIFWTLYYDTIYATQDKKDDLKLGLYSTAIFFQNHLKKALFFCAAATFTCVILGGYFMGGGFSYVFFNIIGAVAWFFNFKKFNPQNILSLSAYFRQSALIQCEIFINLLFFL